MANNKKKNEKTVTRKRVKVEGIKRFIDADTGEIQEMTVSTIEERDFNFTKVWMMSLMPQLKLIGNRKIDVCMWIIENLNRDNQLVYTYRQIADKCEVSLDTVTSTMKALQECDFLRRQNSGCYIVNPDVLFKGTRGSRMSALFQFNDAGATGKSKPTSLSLQQQRDELQENINVLNKRLKKLNDDIEDLDLEDEVIEEGRKRRKAQKANAESD